MSDVAQLPGELFWVHVANEVPWAYILYMCSLFSQGAAATLAATGPAQCRGGLQRMRVRTLDVLPRPGADEKHLYLVDEVRFGEPFWGSFGSRGGWSHCSCPPLHL